MWKQHVRHQLIKAAHKAGLGPSAGDDSHYGRRARAMQVRGVDLVIDVGGNVGQYALDLRRRGYTGKIHSYEPDPAASVELLKNSADDDNWMISTCAAADATTTLSFTTTRGSDMSSLLRPTDDLVKQLPHAEVTGQIEVPAVRLDDDIAGEMELAAAPMLKVDVQGGEHAVLDGLGDLLSRFVLVEIEMGFQELYVGGSTIFDLLPRFEPHGFHVVSVNSNYANPETGQVLDADFLLGR